MIYLTMIGGGLIGILLHILIVIKGIKKRMPVFSYRDVFEEYWKTEWLSLLFSFVSFFGLLYVASEFIDLKKIDNSLSEPLPERLLHFRISNFIKCSSILAGYFADSVVYACLGIAEKKLNQKIKDLTDQTNINNNKN